MKSKIYSIANPKPLNEMGTSSWISRNKWSLFFGLTTLCFAIATIVLAVELSKALDDDEGNSSDNSTTSTTTTPQTPLQPWEEDLRIPADVTPSEYEVSLWPFIANGTFSGSVSVKIALANSRDWIPIHIKDMIIESVELFDGDSKSVELGASILVPSNEFYVIRSKAPIPAGSYTLKMEFIGNLINKITGFYTSVYTDSRGPRGNVIMVRPASGRYISSNLLFGLVGTCAVLTVLSACLISTLVILRQFNCHESSEAKWEKSWQIGEYRMDSNVKEAIMHPWEKNNRIPKAIVPIHYDIFLHPDLEKGTFNGETKIDITVLDRLPYIAIHAKDLNITATSLVRVQDSVEAEVTVRDAFYSSKNAFWIVRLPDDSPLKPGTVRLDLKFNGLLTGKIVGFYRSTYKDRSGKVRSIVSSKFEPTDARAAFPCFDEPGLKAKFTISLVRPKNGYNALSNMNILSETDGTTPDTTIVKFQTSNPMSTYLVCFIVSDFSNSGAVQVDNGINKLDVRVYSTPEQVNNTAVAKSVAAQVVKWYIDYFGIALPLPKLDLIGIPDFVSGAMENWGLITFRETALLYDPAVNSATNQKRVATVVAHEIAHQWFGDLVTMAWWDDLWLNEGFARFMETKSLAQGGCAECAEWNLLDQTKLDVVQAVMVTDTALNSHPIVQTVSNPDQINQLFDSISYEKGAAVLTMLENFMGEDKFRTGLQNYLKDHQLSNAASADLWASLNNVAPANVNVSTVMATWTEQKGFPVIDVKRNDKTIELTQRRFLPDASITFDESESMYRYKWDIPIRYFTSSNPDVITWFKREDEKVVLDIDRSVPYVKLNSKQVGYYRVNYEIDQWNALIANFKTFSIADRSHLFDDAFNLARSGYLSYNVPLDMAKNTLPTENDYLPWYTAITGLGNLRALLADSPIYPQFRTFEKNLLTGFYGSGANQFSWTVPDADPHLRRLHRVVFLQEACNVGVTACLNDVGELFKKWLDAPETYIAPDLKVLVYMQGMKVVGGEAEWDALWQRYLKETNAQEKVNFLRALACVKEPWIIKKYLELAWFDENVRSQDYTAVLGYIASTPVGSAVLWDYYRSHWPQLVERFTTANRNLGTSILSVTTTFTTQLKLDELRAFYQQYPDAGAGSAARANAEENIENRITWAKRSVGDIEKWLS